jgi:predicted RNA-binding protein with RPS1 domain
LSDKLVKDPADIVKEGETVKVKILSISSTERHLGLSLKAVPKGTEVTKPRKKISKEELASEVESAIEEEISAKE